MSQPPAPHDDLDRAHALERGLLALIERLAGGVEPGLALRTRQTVEQLAAALVENARAEQGQGLSALLVAQIRLGKFAASRLPAALYRSPAQLAELRAAVQALALAYLGEQDR